MQILVTCLYVLALALSVAGAALPWWKARSRRAKGERAQAEKKRLDDLVAAAEAAGDDEALGKANTVRHETMRAPFEGGPWSLTGWTEPVLFGGGTGASRAAASERDRRDGLGLIAGGVVVGSIASILSVWLLPS